MMIRLTLATLIILTTGCTYFEQADDRRAVEKACGVDMLKDPTLEQLYCMEEVGKSYPNYQSLAHKIEEKKKQESQTAKAQLEACKITETTDKGGIIEAPRTHPIPMIKEKARQHCEQQNLAKFRILNIQVVKKMMTKTTEAKDEADMKKTAQPVEVYVQKAEFECS